VAVQHPPTDDHQFDDLSIILRQDLQHSESFLLLAHQITLSSHPSSSSCYTAYTDTQSAV